MLGFVCLFVIFYFYPAAWSPKGYGSDLSLPIRMDNLFSSRSTHFLPQTSLRGHRRGIPTSPSPQIRQKALPGQRKETKEKEQIRNDVWLPPSLLRCLLGSGLDLHLDRRVHLLSHLLLGGRGLVLGCLRSLSSLLLAWAGGGLPTPRKLMCLPLGSAGVSPCPMRALAVGALGGHMRAPMALSGPASLDGTLVVMCGVVLRTEGTPRGF